ncbi:hypothetical protein PODOV008v2_p0022 [Vibrio phage 44E38.1]|nr:hypothetical protein PODOV001v2_p0022 [Vibrio phage 41E34.2]QZI91453.1 hypothetical protein PODOV048v2_p0022 [Vibrio phage 34E29.1]QZI91490.1 hypothetical protein PODOV007v2_p0022 [Vibrio phage 36E38.1]QZI91759.1 hypothetical protein PODOV008v2_p0022 [Vibrio phage 44E38.1]QZI91796.1 hypothetical protein PODOV046v2_p0022 [Vibrio phage 44E38.2]QZI92110.1 hypothetical protein PODOV047v2_p0022 [Vibrio phage 75E35.1]
MKKASMKVLAVIAAVALFGLVGQMDYEDAVKQEAHYCDMVEAGNWPAYRDDIFCSKVEGE